MARGISGPAGAVPVVNAISASNATFSGTVRITGGPNITVGTDASGITISGAAGAGGGLALAGSNTTYTSGTVELVGSNIVTVRSTTGNRLVIDASTSQSVQTQGVLSAGVSTGGNTAGATGVNTGSRFVIVGAGAITASQTTGAGATTLTLSAAAQTTQTQNLHNLTLTGNTAGVMAQVSSGTLTLAGGNNITLSQAGNAITISGAAAGGAQTGISSIGASNTTYTSGGVTFTGSNIVTVRSTTGQGIVIDASVAAQTVQTQGILSAGVSTGGNTAGQTTVNTGSRLVFAGAGAVSLSQATAAGASTLSISVGAQTAQTGISGLVGSNATYTSGTVTFTGVGGGVTVSSNTGQRIDISVAAPVAQTVQTQNLHNVTLSGNTAGVMAQVSSGTMTLAGGNNITLSQNGNAITISGAAAGGAQTGISSIAASNTTYTSGGITITGSNAVTVRSTTGQGIVIDAPVQTAQTGISSIAASNTTYTSGGITFTGSNIVTVRSTTGQGIVIDASVAAQTVQTQGILSAGVSNVGNTAGNTTVNTGSRLVLAGAGAVSLSQATAGGASTISISVGAQTAQTGLSGVAASNTTYTSGTFTITGVGGGVTISSNTGQRIDISVAAPVAQTVQTQNVHNVTLSGNTAGVMAQISSGTLTLAGGNNITLSQNGNAVTISGAAGGGAGFSAGASNVGNTAGSTGVTGTRLVLAGVGEVTLSQSTDANGATVSIDHAEFYRLNVGVSTGGNTAGNTVVTRGNTFVLAGGNNITLSQGTGVGSTTVTISAANQTVQTQNLHNLTLAGNTAGALAQVSSGTLTLAGGANITLSQAGNAITISGGGGGGGNFSAGVSTGGNTAGATGITGTQNVYVGSSGITLSQTIGANGGTITINGPGQWAIPSISYFDMMAGKYETATNNLRGVATANGTWFFFPLTPGNDLFPGNMTVSSVRINMSGSNTVTTASTGSWTLSYSIAYYTRNGSTLSLINSGSGSVGSGAANASNSSLYHGMRWLRVDRSGFSQSTLSFSQDAYWAAVAFRSSGEAKLLSMLGGGFMHLGSSNRSGILGTGSSTGSSTMLDYPFYGVYTASSTAAPVSVTRGQIARPGNTGSANFSPHMVLDNLGLLDA